ncbi:MAG TPA: tetratricopeptide repeat protein [Bryobacteraceae bacterium]|nr:tetratricopeptide repeat protein [Bryobacteraceae bacterium]
MSANERVTVGVLASTPAVCSDLQVCLRQLPVQVVLDERVTRPDPMLLNRLQGLHPELVLVEQPADRSSIQALLRTIAKAAPASMIVMVNGCADPDAILEAVRAGARDYIYVPLADPLTQVITRLRAARPKVQQTTVARRARGRVIGFLAAKGGCGATTVALHAAVGMARESGQPTGLADFDLSCGMVKFLTNSRSQYTVLDAAANAGRLDDSFWSALITECSGIEVLSAPAPLAMKEYPETAQFGAVVDFMRSRYAWSLVDLGRGIHTFPASLLEHFDEIYVVTTPDRLALAQAKRVADSLRHGCSFRNVRLVVNRSPAAAAVEIERLTGLDVYATLVDAEDDLHDALADTRMISDKAPLSRQMGTFARRMAGLSLESQATETAGGLMGGFRKLVGRVRQATQGRADGARPETAWEALSASAETAFKNGQYDLAADHLTQAVEEARSFGDGDLRYGRSLNRLGVVQCHQGKHAEAERSLKTAAKALERALGEADPSVLEVQSNLAGVYRATRQHETARQLYESVLKTAESALGPNHTMVAWTLDGLGDVHLAQNEPTAALYAYRRALSIKEQTLGPSDWDVAITLDKISEFYHAMGRYNEAEPLLWRAIEIRTTVLGRGCTALSKHFILLGGLYASQRRYSEAERVLRYGIAIAPTDDRAEEMLPSLHKLAEVCEGQARFGEAESIRSIARRIVANGADYAKVLASEFGAQAAMVPNAPQGLRAGWAQTSF